MDTVQTFRKKVSEKYAPLLLVALGFLLPLFFIPSASIPFSLHKSLILGLVAVFLFCFWLIEKLKSGEITIPWSLFLGFAFLVPLSYLISSFFSGSVSSSIIGAGGETDTAFSAMLFFLALFLVPIFLKTRGLLFNFLVAIFLSFFVFGIIELLRLFFGPWFLSFGIFTNQVSNFLGTWNEVSLFAGLAVILSLISLELLPRGGLIRYLIYSVFALAIFLLVVVGFELAWYLVGLFSLASFVYAFSYSRDLPEEATQGGRLGGRVSIPPLVVIFLSIVFIIFGQSLKQPISSFFEISHVEARPSWGSTLNIAKKVYSDSPLFGVGPNQFSREWVKQKPLDVNESIFWAVDFNSGIGYIPTSFVTVGLIGAISWLLFLGYFMYEGVRMFMRTREDHFTRYLSVASFVGALYLWVICFTYTPTLPFVALAFLLSGVFLSTLIVEGFIKLRTFQYGSVPSTNFATILAIILLLIGVATSVFFFGQRFVSSIFYSNGFIALNRAGDLNLAEKELRRAITFGGTDLHYRAMSQLALLRLNEVANKANTEPQETTRANFELYLGGAIQSAQLARNYDQGNYQNWLSLGRSYESVVTLNIPGAYENAKASYEEAAKLNPTNPFIPLSLARLEAAKRNNAAARAYIEEARKLKKNYTDAIFLLSQIEIAEGNIDDAIESVESASLLTPNDPAVFFQLGFLKYSDRQYKGAITSLEKAVSLQNGYANAKYFLGLSYYYVDREDDAIRQFEEIQATNPDNEEVKFILNNLRAGRQPFANVAPPLDDSPEERKRPPISESEE